MNNVHIYDNRKKKNHPRERGHLVTLDRTGSGCEELNARRLWLPFAWHAAQRNTIQPDISASVQVFPRSVRALMRCFTLVPLRFARASAPLGVLNHRPISCSSARHSRRRVFAGTILTVTHFINRGTLFANSLVGGDRRCMPSYYRPMTFRAFAEGRDKDTKRFYLLAARVELITLHMFSTRKHTHWRANETDSKHRAPCVPNQPQQRVKCN